MSPPHLLEKEHIVSYVIDLSAFGAALELYVDILSGLEDLPELLSIHRIRFSLRNGYGYSIFNE